LCGTGHDKAPESDLGILVVWIERLYDFDHFVSQERVRGVCWWLGWRGKGRLGWIVVLHRGYSAVGDVREAIRWLWHGMFSGYKDLKKMVTNVRVCCLSTL